MAPSRRRGVSKAAAAAAAARRQWKVGDLVLAKVKGFPAWPATVSEPEKWGYSADLKKVLVYFFGTQQIAFCNHADVEAFTEEKKQSLLGKRHGKGADFGRAVKEIIAIYEKSKKQDQADVINSANEVTRRNGGETMESSTMNMPKDDAEIPAETLHLRLNASDFASDRSSPSLPIDDAVKQVDSSHDEEESLPDGPSESVVIAEVPLLATYTSRKRSRAPQQRTSVTQRRSPSARRLRSSLKVEPNNDGSKGGKNTAVTGAWDRSSSKNKWTRKSPVLSDCNDGCSPTLASDVSAEDYGSEIAMVESDSLSPHESSSMDFDSKLEHTETVECLEGGVELSKGLNLQMKEGIIRKKRNPNRKRGMNEVVEHIVILDKEGGQNSQYISEKANERNSKEDGDEHLPLVKRARVRMGRPSSVEALNNLQQVEEKPSREVAAFSAGQISSPLNCGIRGNNGRNSVLASGTSDQASLSKDCTQASENWTHWKFMKNQSFGCSADDEAALPPSKRLHRALEAMSANVAEEGLASIEASSNEKTSINGCCVSHMSVFPDTAEESREGNGLGVESVNCYAKDSIQIGASGHSSCSNPVNSDNTISSVGDEICDTHTVICKRGEHEFDKDLETRDDECNLVDPSASIHTIQTVVNIESPGGLSSPNFVREQPIPSLNQGSSDQLLTKNDEDGCKDIQFIECRAENPDKEYTMEHTSLCLDNVVGEAGKILPGDDTNLDPDRSDGTGSGNNETLKSQDDENCQVNDMCEVVSNKARVKALQKDRSSASVSSDDRLSDKVTSDVRSSSGQIDGVDCPAQLLSPSTVTFHISTSESANFSRYDGCSSPNVHLDQGKSFVTLIADEGKSESAVTQRSKVNSRWSNYAEAQAALSSFEAILATLTGKKESIGRATRIAIDCVKLGVATAKVMEILVRNMESESSFHRKVDMIFLVDSITQCSQNMKGDVGGMYLSAIQSFLPRLLSAAAPPGSAAQENRRQCKKVLRVWLDRKILPESFIRYHIRALDSHGGAFSADAYSRRSSRTERSLDDPVREMDGMLVDEYGSNSSFQLPGFCMPRMLKDEDEGSDSDGSSFEAVTPEHKPETPKEQETTYVIEKHRHILKDVDGELEMEDVAPPYDVEMNQSSTVAGADLSQSSHDRFDQHFLPPHAPSLPKDVPPSSPPLPSIPPPPHPPPSFAPPQKMSSSYDASSDSVHVDTNQDMVDNSRQAGAHHSVSPRMNPTSDSVPYHARECRDHHQMHRQIPDSANSFGRFSGRSANNVQHNDGVRFHSKPYPPRPPHPAPSDQFSYVQVEHRVKSRRDVPPPSFNRFHGMHSTRGGSFYNNHDRMKPAPYEDYENWRFDEPFPGPRYPDRGKMFYPHDPYIGPSRESTRLHSERWSLPPWAVHHRNSMPTRHHYHHHHDHHHHPYEAPSFWRPR